MIYRKYDKEIEDHLSMQEISVLVGPRQAGKTTIMNVLREKLVHRGERTLSLNLDFDSDRPFFNSQQDLLARIHLEFGGQHGYVFIDEIQRLPDAGLFLKGIYDRKPNCKLIVTGSGSLEIKGSIQESLAGRKRLFEIHTLSFRELLNYRTDQKYADRLVEFCRLEKARAGQVFLEYLMFGGYPRVVLAEGKEEKKLVLSDIYRSCLEKDISYLLKVDKVDAFGDLVRILASQAGKVVNVAELSSTVGLSAVTVANYVSYAEKTFMLYRVAPFFRNVRTEISKAPVVYFHDIGLCNLALRVWGDPVLCRGDGFLFQNFVFRLLADEFSGERVRYWRSKDKAEMDFVIELGGKVIGIEVKCTDLKRPALERGARGFIARIRPAEVWVINLSFEHEEAVDGVPVRWMPYYELLASHHFNQ